MGSRLRPETQPPSVHLLPAVVSGLPHAQLVSRRQAAENPETHSKSGDFDSRVPRYFEKTASRTERPPDCAMAEWGQDRTAPTVAGKDRKPRRHLRAIELGYHE